METTLYRKYRPGSFDSVFGQTYIKKSIKNALDSNRVAHAYLFSGPRGVGKTTIARIIAKGLNCEKNGISSHPCLECDSCVSITQGSNLDVTEIDAASNRGIEEIRALKENVNYQAVSSRKKVYIIDEVHMLTNEAFNALLKTLEEPPEHVVFILATTELHKLPDTIISRCVSYNFKSLDKEEIIAMLSECAKSENVTIDDESLILIYKKSEGSARDSLSLLEQILVSYTNENIDISKTREALGIVSYEYFEKFNKLIKNEIKEEIIKFIDNLYKESIQIDIFLKDFCDYLRETENDIDYSIRIISIIFTTLNEYKYENNIRIISYIIVSKLFEPKYVSKNNSNITVSKNEVNVDFNYNKFLAYLKDHNNNLFSDTLSAFECISINDYCLYLKQKTGNQIIKAILENESNRRKIEEEIFNFTGMRYIISLIDNNKNISINVKFIEKVKELFEVERM